MTSYLRCCLPMLIILVWVTANSFSSTTYCPITLVIIIYLPGEEKRWTLTENIAHRHLPVPPWCQIHHGPFFLWILSTCVWHDALNSDKAYHWMLQIPPVIDSWHFLQDLQNFFNTVRIFLLNEDVRSYTWNKLTSAEGNAFFFSQRYYNLLVCIVLLL